MSKRICSRKSAALVGSCVIALVGATSVALAAGPEYKSAVKIARASTGTPKAKQTARLTKLPKGKTVAFMDCGLPPCKVQGKALKQASKYLGFKVVMVPSGTNASAIRSGFDRVLALKPDAVVVVGTPTTFFQAAIRSLNDANIKIVTGFTNDDKAIGPWNVAGGGFQRGLGVRQAAMAATIVKGKGHLLLVNASSIAGQTAQANVIADKMPKYCCGVTRLNVNTADIGKGIPGQVVSAVQRDKSINVIQFTGGDFVTGVPSALKSAGLRKRVKIVATGGPTSYGPLRTGQIDAALGTSQTIVGWAEADAVARKLTGQKAVGLNAIPVQILRPKDVKFKPSQDWPGPKNWQKNYIKLWKVKSHR